MPISQYNYSVSKVFGLRLLDALHDFEFENSVKSILLESGIYPKRKKWVFQEAIKLAYDYLKVNYRCEYVYQNEIANQLLLKYHDDNSATLLKELYISQSIADIVIINGKSTVYEIKTELDNMDRLSGQISEYEQVFDDVYVATYYEAVETVKKIIPSYIGIVVLDNDGKLITDRPSIPGQIEFNSEMAARMLRQTELLSAYRKYIGCLPDVGTGYIGAVCRKWYIELDTNLSHDIFNECLKSRKPSDMQFDLIKKLQPELKMLLFGRDVSKKYCSTISYKLNVFS
jgi:hypothetical protein